MIYNIRNIFIASFVLLVTFFSTVVAKETVCQSCSCNDFVITQYHFPVPKRDWKQRQIISGLFNIDAGIDYALAERIKDERISEEITLTISTRDIESKNLDSFVQLLFPLNKKLGRYISPSFNEKGDYHVLSFERKKTEGKDYQEILWQYHDSHGKNFRAITYIFIFDEIASSGAIHRGSTFTFSSPSDQFDGLKPEFEKMFKEVKIEN